MKFAIFGNIHQTKKSESIDKLFGTIKKWGDSYAIDRPFYEFLCENRHLPIEGAEIIEGDDFAADIAMPLAAMAPCCAQQAVWGVNPYPFWA